MSKYKNSILEIVPQDRIMSTNEVLKELKRRSQKSINWHLVYRILSGLQIEGRIKRLKASAGYFWQRK